LKGKIALSLNMLKMAEKPTNETNIMYRDPPFGDPFTFLQNPML